MHEFHHEAIRLYYWKQMQAEITWCVVFGAVFQLL